MSTYGAYFRGLDLEECHTSYEWTRARLEEEGVKIGPAKFFRYQADSADPYAFDTVGWKAYVVA